MKIILPLILFVCVLGLVPAVAQTSLVAYTALEQNLAAKLFDAYYRDTKIKVNFTRLAANEAEERVEAEKNAPKASIWIGGAAANHASAQQKGLLEIYKTKAADAVPAQFKDPGGAWIGLYLGPIVFATNLEKAAAFRIKPPASWADLLKPEYKNRFRVAFPGSSATGYNVLTAVLYVNERNEDKAFEYFKGFAGNCETFERSGPAPARSVALGEVPVAVGYAQDFVRLKAEGAKVVMTLPKEGTGCELAAMSLVKGGRQSAAAKKLYDWMLGARAQQIFADAYLVPASRSAKGHPLSFKVGEIKAVKHDFQWDAANRARLQERFTREIGGK